MLDDIEFLDDATRPRGPRLTGLTEEQREAGEHLKYIHDHLRQNMQVLRQLIARAAAGEVSREEIEGAAGSLDMLQNFRRFGTLCGQYCQFVQGHHSLEDAAVFPALARQSDVLRKITERLQAEHVVVHELLLRLMGALHRLAEAPGPDTFADCRTVYEALERVLLSHLGYEEEEIGDALGYYGVI
jgi:hemerythrin-like domain-containing protein